MLMPACDADGAAEFADRAREAVSEAHSSRLPGVRMSAGLAAAKAPETMQELLQAADVALYRAKRSGRDRTERFDTWPGAGSEQPVLHASRTRVTAGRVQG